jgi:hypothetical protein
MARVPIGYARKKVSKRGSQTIVRGRVAGREAAAAIGLFGVDIHGVQLWYLTRRSRSV